MCNTNGEDENKFMSSSNLESDENDDRDSSLSSDSADFESDDYDDDDDDALAFQNPIIFQLPNVSQSLLDKARSALHRHQFDESFAWYCTMFECLKESHSAENDEAVKLEDVENEFSTVVNCFSKLLLNQGRTEDANECIQKGIDVYPDNPRLHLAHANQANPNPSCSTFFPNLWKAYLCLRDKKDDSDYSDVYRDLADLLGHADLVDRWHFRMLNDRRRNMAYKIALQQVLDEWRTTNSRGSDRDDSPTLLDLGCGTGLMSAFAVSCGFQNIIACDLSPVMCSIAKDVLQPYCNQQNTISISVFNQDICHMDLSNLADVDVIVTEIFDCAFFGENAINTLRSTYKKLLEYKNGRPTKRPFIMIPSKARVFVTAVESLYLRTMLQTSSASKLFDVQFPTVFLDSSDIGTPKYENINIQEISDCKRISESCQIYEFDFSKPETYDENLLRNLDDWSMHNLKVLYNGHADAFVVHFELELSRSCKVTTSPWDPDSCNCWGQAVFSSLDSLRIRNEGDVIEICHKVDSASHLDVKESIFRDLPIPHYMGAPKPHNIMTLNRFSVIEPLLRQYFEDLQPSQESAENRIETTALIFVESASFLPFWLVKRQEFQKVFVIDLRLECNTEDGLSFNGFRKAVYELNENLFHDGSIQVIQSLDEIENPQQVTFVYCDVVTSKGFLQDFTKRGFDLSVFSEAKFLPKQVNIYTQIISSHSLRSCNEIIDDRNVLGVKLQDRMSIFKSKTFFDHVLGLNDNIISESPYFLGTFSPFDRNIGKTFNTPPVFQNSFSNLSSQLLHSFGLVFSDGLELKTHEHPTYFHLSGNFLPQSFNEYSNSKLVLIGNDFDSKVYLDLVDL